MREGEEAGSGLRNKREWMDGSIGMRGGALRSKMIDA